MRWKWLASAALVVVIGAGGNQINAQYGPPPGPPAHESSPGAWSTPPAEFTAIERRGWREGIDGAMRDHQNRRQPNVNNRDEFRNPSSIPPQDRRAYRAAFRRGYDAGVQHFFFGR